MPDTAAEGRERALPKPLTAEQLDTLEAHALRVQANGALMLLEAVSPEATLRLIAMARSSLASAPAAPEEGEVTVQALGRAEETFRTLRGLHGWAAGMAVACRELRYDLAVRADIPPRQYAIARALLAAARELRETADFT
jgi:hypothetical protein